MAGTKGKRAALEDASPPIFKPTDALIRAATEFLFPVRPNEVTVHGSNSDIRNQTRALPLMILVPTPATQRVADLQPNSRTRKTLLFSRLHLL